MAELVDQTYELVDVDDLEPHPANPRRGEMSAIVESVGVNGFYGALVVQKSTGFVLAGNHRLLAAREQGISRLPVLWVDVDDDRARRILLVDNRSSDLAGDDPDDLAAILQIIEGDGGLAGTGWSEADLAKLLADSTPTSNTDPDDAPAKPKGKPVTKPGDVWQLGPHRLVCGHGEDLDAVQAALDGADADLVFTDPPYGVAYVGKTADALTIENDALTPEELEDLLTAAFTAAHEVLRPGGPFYVCAPSGLLETLFRLSLATAKLELRQQIVWVKNTIVMGRSDYHGQHETILYGWQGGGDPPVPPHFDPEHDTILYGWREGAAHHWEGGRKQSTVWEYDKPSASRVHPTMKPVDLVKRAVANSSPAGGRVLDQFAGSGTTVIAAHLTGRVAAAVELDPAYVDVICRRYQEHTGVVPVRGGKKHDFTKAARNG